MGRKAKRIEVRELIRYFDAYELDGKSMEEIAEWAKDQDVEGYSRVYIDVDSYGYDGGVEFSLMGARMESDAEYEKRVEEQRKARAKEEARRKAKKDEEYQDYLRLKEKFEEV